MNRIAVATVIRGTGECQAYVNGVASAEIQRQQDAMRAETERARTVEASRDRLLASRLAEIGKAMENKPSLMCRFWSRAEGVWAMFFAVVLCWSMALHLVEVVEE